MASGPVEAVAQSPEELVLLSRVVASPIDDLARLVYADWLDERGDPRGTLLRTGVEAIRKGSPDIPLGEAPGPWAELTGLVVSSAFAASGLSAKRDSLLAHARPALRLQVAELDQDDTTPAPDEVGTTRLGGDPDLPAGSTYPTAVDGSPLHFIGQFNLADFAGTVAGQAFPGSGLLSIFRPKSVWGACIPSPEDFSRLVTLTPAGKPLARTPRPTGSITDEPGESDQLAPYRPELRVTETLRLPAMWSKWPGVDIAGEERDRLSETLDTCLGGEAYILLGHATHGNTGVEPLIDRPDWVQLVLVPYFEGPDFGQSDASLSYHLPAIDLKAGRFDRLEATFG